jgi:HSP20 family protein
MKTLAVNPVLSRGFNGFFDELFNNVSPRLYRDDRSLDDFFRGSPAVNVKETDNGYEMQIAAPGVRKEDLKLNINDKTLTIAYEAASENKESDEKWLRHEFKVRSFKRSFTLSDKIDGDKISAAFENGILTVSLPKKETALVSNKTIEIA